MEETIFLVVIFVIAASYIVYKLYPKKGGSCGCGCGCGTNTKKEKKENKE